MIELFYCGNNKALVDAARGEGFSIGTRSDKTPFPPVRFVDIEYRNPNFESHLSLVATLQPHYATVPDLSEVAVDGDDVDRALGQAARLQSYCQAVMIIPKLSGQIAMIPSEYTIGYSVPTKYGGAQYPLWELAGRRVHLLGGSPHAQYKIYAHVGGIASVTSADGNMAQKLAIERLKYWCEGPNKWVRWSDSSRDQYVECFRQSCRNIRKMWLRTTPDGAGAAVGERVKTVSKTCLK